MVLVYVENAHNLPMYQYVLSYNGTDLLELKNTLRNNLDLGPKICVEVYDRRLGMMHRKLLNTLPENQTTVYVILKVEGCDASN